MEGEVFVDGEGCKREKKRKTKATRGKKEKWVRRREMGFPVKGGGVMNYISGMKYSKNGSLFNTPYAEVEAEKQSECVCV